MTEEQKTNSCETSEVEELILQYTALNRKHELMDEFASCQQEAEEKDIGPSPELDAAIYSMINDVAKKHKKIRTKRRVRKGFTVAAILCLILLACPAIAFAVSPTFRLNVMELVSNWQDDHVSIRMEESASTDWLPEGFVLVNEEITESITYRQYTNNDQFIDLKTYVKGANINIDNENNTHSQEYEINGNSAIVTQQPDLINIIWFDDDNMFHLTTNLSLETALAMARQIK